MPALQCKMWKRFLHHSAHAVVVAVGFWSFWLWDVADETLSREEKSGNRRGVLESAASHFSWVNDTASYEVLVGVSCDVVSNVSRLVLHVLNDERTFATCVCSKLAERRFDSR